MLHGLAQLVRYEYIIGTGIYKADRRDSEHGQINKGWHGPGTEEQGQRRLNPPANGVPRLCE